MIDAKACCACRGVKPLGEFHKQSSSRDGRQPRCIDCSREYQAARWLTEDAKAKQKVWKENNPERLREIRRRKNLKQFGLSIEDYDAMLMAQGGVCAICATACTTGRRLAVDHDHETGKVRGLLCFRCNRGIGLFRDDAEYLGRASEYLGVRNL